MKKQSLKLFIATLIIGIATVSSAYAAQTLNVVIPFDFQIAGKQMVSGKYQIVRIDSSKIILKNLESNKSVLAIAATQVGNGRSVSSEKIVFNRYGDTYFLREIYSQKGSSGRSLSESKTERSIRKGRRFRPRLARNKTQPEKISVDLTK